MGWLGNFISKLSNKGGGFLFLRSQLSSQVATIFDNVSAFALKKLLDFARIKVVYIFSRGIEAYVIATVVGQIIGGAVSCFLNYKWAFKSLDVKFKYVIIKFLLVWIGSITLNTFLTFVITEWLKSTRIVESILGPYYADDIFIVAKLLVAIVVGFVWNFNMYKYFVFKNIDSKKFFKKMLKQK